MRIEEAKKSLGEGKKTKERHKNSWNYSFVLRKFG